jgi:hypothetical protein
VPPTGTWQGSGGDYRVNGVVIPQARGRTATPAAGASYGSCLVYLALRL